MICFSDASTEFDVSSKIVGGEAAESSIKIGELQHGIKKRIIMSENSIPWQVGLLRKKYEIFCGGVLLSNAYILSAAHCTENALKFDNKDYAVIGSRFNAYSLEPDDLHLLSKNHHIHPRWQRFNKRDDARGTKSIYLYTTWLYSNFKKNSNYYAQAQERSLDYRLQISMKIF